MQAGGLGHRPDPAPDRARGAEVRPRAPARPARGAARDHRARGGATARRPPGAQVKDLGLPDGSLVISILRDGRRLRADRRLGDRGRRRGARSCSTSGSRPSVTERFTARRARRLAVAAARRRLPADRRRARRRPTARAGCARRARDGSILLVGREPDPPYNRPPLSKGYLQGKESREDVLFRPDEWWERAADRAADAHERDEARRRASAWRRCRTRRRSRFDKALLATGANVRRLRVDGCELDGIHYLRAFGNSDAIRADAEQAERVVLIGGSYIGCEVAASLTAAHGVECAIVMLEDVTLERAVRQGGRAASSRACWRSTASRSTAATSSSASRATDGRVTQGRHEERARARLRLRGDRRRRDART